MIPTPSHIPLPAAIKPGEEARCNVCKNLTITRLVQSAKIELAGMGYVPDRPDAYFQHHSSVNALENSASAGCDLCTLFVDTLKGYEEDDDWTVSSDTWVGSGCDPSKSLFSVVKQPSAMVPSTDIKLCIASGRSTEPEIMGGKVVLDTIVLQVGPTQKAEKDPELNGEFEEPDFPRLFFKLTVPRDQSTEVDGYHIGRYKIPIEVSHDKSFDIARSWLHECETSHANCLTDALPEIPTRVIDVCTYMKDVRIHTSNEKTAQYAALSHCWGGPISPMLTSDTLATFENCLPYSDLPANFQDAITITRRLGIQYIWIDSLCIIQDSKQDWEEQSKKMGSIYRNSTITISALASEGSKRGILTSKNKPYSPKTEPVTTTISVTASESTSAGVVQVERLDPDEETLNNLDTSGPLAQRGWCLQESVLSPRQLYFGRRQIYWRCPQGYSSADGSTHGIRVPEIRFQYISAVLYKDILRDHGTAEIAEVMRDYYWMIQQYSQRSLTYASDKLPAFSGISSQLQAVVGGTYLAGVWSSDIVVGLLWEKETRTSAHVSSYRAPSWSWAVTDESVLYTTLENRQESASNMTLLDHQVTLKDENNPYGEIAFASITVRALTISLVRSEQHNQGYIGDSYYYGSLSFDDDPPRLATDDSTHAQPVHIRTTPDIFIVKNKEDAYLLSMTRSYGKRDNFDINYDLFTDDPYLGMIVQAHEKDDGSAKTTIKGLVLKPVNAQDNDADYEYERVGLFTFTDFEPSWLESWVWKTMILV